MGSRIRPSIRIVWLLIIFIALCISTCNAPLIQSAGEDSEPLLQLATQSQGLNPGDESGDNGDGSLLDPDRPVPLSCPEEDEKATLEFDHNISWGIPDFYDMSIVADGLILFNLTQSIVDHEPAEQVGIFVIQPGPVTANVTATIKDCVQKYETTLTFIPAVRGTCIDGVFNLTIIEAWQETKVNVICDNEDEFDIPLPFGSQVHTVAGAIGEIATKEKRFPYQFEGFGGSGEWAYRISYWYIP